MNTNSTTTLDPQVGDLIAYRGSWGRGEQVQATIKSIGKHPNTKTCYMLDDGLWCYLYQIDEVIS